ncbi:unnamed protein product [Periconia digitata]|uniref:Uncharacterized protein n=1 Tax=Periconia digitata TaxID=1303443 RepID=A0A9W4ULC4_9PLEO|nr:unnamed protein product [Periconia digitata]
MMMIKIYTCACARNQETAKGKIIANHSFQISPRLARIARTRGLQLPATIRFFTLSIFHFALLHIVRRLERPNQRPCTLEFLISFISSASSSSSCRYLSHSTLQYSTLQTPKKHRGEGRRCVSIQNSKPIASPQSSSTCLIPAVKPMTISLMTSVHFSIESPS